MTNRLVSVGDDFTLPDAVKVEDPNLPDRLQAAELNATYAKLPGLTRNALTGYYHADGCGAVGDTTTDNTAVLQGMIDDIIAAGGGTLFIPYIEGQTNIYRFNQLVINGTGNLDLTIKAAPGVILRPAPLLTTDCIIIDSEATVVTDPFLRRVTLQDLVIQGQESWESGTKIPRRGIVLGRCQDVRLDNVKLFQFQKGALVLDDCWDSVFTDVEIKWSGYGTDASNYAYALQFKGTVDNSNANKFTNLHMEFCPLMASFDNLARHNLFENCKFEHGGETETNASTKSPFYFGNSIETSFSNCFFTENKPYETYFIRSDVNTDAYLTTYALRKRTQFIGCEFFAISTTKARWFSGNDTQFIRCGFQRSDGMTGGSNYAFDFESRNSMTNCQVAFADAGAGFCRVTGTDNEIRSIKIFTANSGTNNAVLTLGSSALRTLWDEVAILNGASAAITSALTYFGNNVCRNSVDPSVTITGGGAKSVFTKRNVKLNDAGAQTYTDFIHGWSGQSINVTGGTANQTVQHSASIILKAGANKTLAAGESIRLENVDGVWREV